MQSFDADGDGVLSGDEVPKLPAPFKANKKDQLDFGKSSVLCSGGFRIFRRGYLGLAYFMLAVLVMYLIVGN